MDRSIVRTSAPALSSMNTATYGLCTRNPPSVVANVNATASSFAVSHAEPEDVFVAAVVVAVVLAVVFVVVFEVAFFVVFVAANAARGLRASSAVTTDPGGTDDGQDGAAVRLWGQKGSSAFGTWRSAPKTGRKREVEAAVSRSNLRAG